MDSLKIQSFTDIHRKPIPSKHSVSSVKNDERFSGAQASHHLGSPSRRQAGTSAHLHYLFLPPSPFLLSGIHPVSPSFAVQNLSTVQRNLTVQNPHPKTHSNTCSYLEEQMPFGVLGGPPYLGRQ